MLLLVLPLPKVLVPRGVRCRHQVKRADGKNVGKQAKIQDHSPSACEMLSSFLPLTARFCPFSPVPFHHKQLSAKQREPRSADQQGEAGVEMNSSGAAGFQYLFPALGQPKLIHFLALS